MSVRRFLLTGRSALPVPAQLAQVIARRRLRKRMEAAVSRLIDALDVLDGDPEAEPWLGAPELPGSCRAVMLLPGFGWQHTPTLEWARGANDDGEVEDEHGGDVLDEPHDPEPDEEDGRDLPLRNRAARTHIDRLLKLKATGPEAAGDVKAVTRLRGEVADLRNSLGEEPVRDHAVGDIDLNRGEPLHIHNGCVETDRFR